LVVVAAEHAKRKGKERDEVTSSRLERGKWRNSIGDTASGHFYVNSYMEEKGD